MRPFLSEVRGWEQKLSLIGVCLHQGRLQATAAAQLQVAHVQGTTEHLCIWAWDRA